MIVLLLIRKSIVSLRRHLERVTDRLPVYHDDNGTDAGIDGDGVSTNSTTSPSHHKDSASGVRLNSIHSHHHRDSPMHEVEAAYTSRNKNSYRHAAAAESQHYPDPPPLPPEMASAADSIVTRRESRP